MGRRALAESGVPFYLSVEEIGSSKLKPLVPRALCSLGAPASFVIAIGQIPEAVPLLCLRLQGLEQIFCTTAGLDVLADPCLALFDGP